MTWDGFAFIFGAYTKVVSAAADEQTAFSETVAYLATNNIPGGQFVVVPTGTTPSTYRPGMALHDQESILGY